MRQTKIQAGNPAKSREVVFEAKCEEDPEYLVKLQIVRPYVSYEIEFSNEGPLIHLTTEWSKQEIIQLRGKLTEIIEAME